MTLITRRTLVTGGALGAGLLLSGCDKLAQQPGFRRILFSGEKINMGLQRALMDRNALAPEFSAEQMSPVFRTNGNSNPNTADYNRHVAENFANWRLEVGGLVDRPLRLSLSDIGAFPQRAQITRHDCVEGWSAIGKWQGPRLSHVLDLADGALRLAHLELLLHDAPPSGFGVVAAQRLAVGRDHDLGRRVAAKQPAGKGDRHGERLECSGLDPDHRAGQHAGVGPLEPVAHRHEVPGRRERLLVGVHVGEGAHHEGEHAGAAQRVGDLGSRQAHAPPSDLVRAATSPSNQASIA